MMNTKWVLKGVCVVFLVGVFGQSNAQDDQNTEPRFSHTGIKGAIGVGSLEASSERNLNEGDLGYLALGYGFSERFSMWLAAVGSEHAGKNQPGTLFNLGGLELLMQHKFLTESSLQPYGKVGVGFYALEEDGSDITFFGGGFNFALGADYFFSRHFGVGAELTFKQFDYSHKSVDVPGGNLVSELNEDLDGDSVGFMVTLTIQ